jgi:molybdopterin converting factor small subunit
MNQEINEWEEELKAIVSKLAKNTREELYSQYAYSKKWLEQAIVTINNLITMLMSIEENIKDDNEVRVFAKVTEGKKVVEEGQTMLSNQSKYYRHVCLMFEIDDYLKNLGIMLSSLGLITTKYEEVRKENNQTQEYKIVRYRDYRINESCCTVSAVCALDDQTVLIFERTSTRLKRYSMRDIKVINQLQMNNCSHSICSLTSGEVAVAFNQKNKIQFVSVAGTTMTMTRSFTTVHGCWGVSFNKITGELCVSDGGSLVAVYNRTGQLMKTYQHDSTGRQLFTCSRNIAWSEDNTKLYVTDSKKGLIALDDSGTLLWVFTDPDLTSATGITVLPGDVILVSGLTSHNVLQVNKYGKRVGTAIGVRGCTCLNYPWALAFDRKSSILIVGHNKNIIQTYGLQICLKVNLK